MESINKRDRPLQRAIDPNDIVPRRFGRLVVNHYHGWKRTGADDKLRVRHYYCCTCDCGRQVKAVQRDSLLQGRTKSCGCLKRKGRRKS